MNTTPSDPHVAATWSRCGRQVVSIWPPCGHHLTTTWSPCGRHVVTKWPPRGHQVVATWTPNGRHVVPVWPPSGPHLAATWPLVATWTIIEHITFYSDGHLKDSVANQFVPYVLDFFCHFYVSCDNCPS